jgi:DNA-binding NarL/FixJ family response regulator
MFEGLIVSQDPFFSALLKERLLRLLPQPAHLLIHLGEKHDLLDDSSATLIILDLGENPTDRLFLLEKYKKARTNARLVVFSENSSLRTRQQAVQQGADRFLVTPTTDAEWNEMEEQIVTLVKEMPTERASAVKATGPNPFLTSTTRLTIPAELLGAVPPEGMEPLIVGKEPTTLPPMESHWRIGLNGELLSSSQVKDLERAIFITHFIYIRMADISVALERDYFNHIFLHGPKGDQILVTDQEGIHHGILEKKNANEEQREQFILWCCEQKL